MSAREVWKELEGSWAGTKKVWVEPGAPVRDSGSSAEVALVAQTGYLAIRYTWTEGGRAQDGLLLIRLPSEKEGAVDAAWVDSWHQRGEIMLCRGEGAGEGVLTALGRYAAPPDPDWGWRIELRPSGADAWEMLMYNITPDGQEALGVQASFTRVE